jgi:protein gp37
MSQKRELVSDDSVEVARQIKAAHTACMAGANSAVENAIEAGRLLTGMKSKLIRGSWLPWVEDKCDLKIRQAQRYMRVYENRQRIEDEMRHGGTHLTSLNRVIGALTDHREKPRPSREGDAANDEETPIVIEAKVVSEGPEAEPTPIVIEAKVVSEGPEAEPTPIVMELPKSKPTFNQTNEMVSWAKWTWNPVTGCEHTCVYCYARDIANMRFPEKFAPTYHPNRLKAPKDTKVPDVSLIADPVEKVGSRNVFVCSMADLFGRWVPQEWIDAVFDSCRESPQWNYLFLTKFPQRYSGLRFPETSWVGTTVDEQKRVANAEKAFRKIKVPVKWLSVEPMREPLQFTDLSMFDWVVIGGQSKSSGAPQFFPPFHWVNDLIHDAHRAGCKVYCKPNTDPDGHWAGLMQEYPDIFTRQGGPAA